MKNIGIIPARMGSSRFPGKPMAKILGLPMIGHVYKRSKMAKSLDEVFVATCDLEIKEYIESLGGKAIMTSDKHERATDRTAEAIEKIEKQYSVNIQTIIMIQGDEPMVTAEMIDKAMGEFKRLKVPTVLNLYSKIQTMEEFLDPNQIKVAFNNDKTQAICFSREPIPNRRNNKDLSYAYKQVCIMPFTKEFLTRFNSLAPTPLEIIESVDMMRVLEHGDGVYMAESPGVTHAVDTPEDLVRVEKIIADSLLTKLYL